MTTAFYNIIKLFLFSLIFINFEVTAAAKSVDEIMVTASQNATVEDIDKFINNFDLKTNDETMSGHIMYRHVGKSDDWLDGRLFGDRKLRFASTYYNLDTAQNAIKETMLDNKEKILLWLNSDKEKLKTSFSKKFAEPLGISLAKHERKKMDATMAVVVLKRKESGKNNFYVLTSYPVATHEKKN